MPFHIRKFKTGWRVYDDKGKSYSNKPLTKKTATAQLRALYANIPEARTFRGSGYCMMNNDIYLDGDGFFSDFFSKVKDVAKGAFDRITGVSKGIREGYSPKARSYLEKYGNYIVTNIFVRRKPIVRIIDKFLNFISFGKLDEAKSKLKYDDLFHLSMVMALRPPDRPSGSGGVVYIRVEKNEVINIDDMSYREVISQPYIQFGVPLGYTFRGMMDAAQKSKGPDFFKYDAFNNNCQIFVAGILQASGLLTERLKAFILQDTESILKQLPSYVKPFARGVTDIGALANVALEGQGMIKMTTKDFIAEHKKLVKLLNESAGKLGKEAKEQAAEAKAKTGKNVMRGGVGTPEQLRDIVDRLIDIKNRIEADEIDADEAREEATALIDEALDEDIGDMEIADFAALNGYADDEVGFVNRAIEIWNEENPGNIEDEAEEEVNDPNEMETASEGSVDEMSGDERSEDEMSVDEMRGGNETEQYQDEIAYLERAIVEKDRELNEVLSELERTDLRPNERRRLNVYLQRIRSESATLRNRLGFAEAYFRHLISGNGNTGSRKKKEEEDEVFEVVNPIPGVRRPISVKEVLPEASVRNIPLEREASLRASKSMEKKPSVRFSRKSSKRGPGIITEAPAIDLTPRVASLSKTAASKIKKSFRDIRMSNARNVMPKAPEKKGCMSCIKNIFKGKGKCPKTGNYPCMCGGAEPLIDEGRLTELNKLILSKKVWEKKRGKRAGSYEDYVAKTRAANIKRATRDLENEARAEKLTKETQQNLIKYKKELEENPGLRPMACKMTKEGRPIKGDPMKNIVSSKECEDRVNKYIDYLNEAQYEGPAGQLLKGLVKAGDFLYDEGIAEAVGVPAPIIAAKQALIPAGWDKVGYVNYSGKGSSKFVKQLEDAGMTSKDYLRKARAVAKKAGYDGRAIELSDDGKHKLMIYDDKGNAVRFGRVGYADFIIWTKTHPAEAEKKRKAYRARATKIKGDWKDNKFSPNNLAINILW